MAWNSLAPAVSHICILVGVLLEEVIRFVLKCAPI